MRRETKSGHSIGNEFPSQRKLTLNYSKLIRKIYGSRSLTAKQKQNAVESLPGIKSDQMEAVIKTTGPALAKTIRAIISQHRGTTRSKKQKNRR